MKIVKMKLKDINFCEYNPRIITKDEQEKLRNSIKKFGLIDTLVVNIHDNKNIVVGGNQRLVILKEMYEPDKIILVSAVDLNETEEKILNIALNKISGDWETNKLIEILKSLEIENDALQLTGFSSTEIEKLLKNFQCEDLNQCVLDGYKKFRCPKCRYEGRAKEFSGN